MTLVAAQRLKQAGVNVDVQMADFAVMFQRMQAANKPLDQGGYNLFAYHAIGSAWFHPLMNLSLDLSCSGKNWAGWPCDPQGEALRQAFLEAPDDASRKVAFAAFQKRLWEFLPYIPLGQFDVVTGWGEECLRRAERVYRRVLEYREEVAAAKRDQKLLNPGDDCGAARQRPPAPTPRVRSVQCFTRTTAPEASKSASSGTWWTTPPLALASRVGTPLISRMRPPALPVSRVRPGSAGTGQVSPAFIMRVSRTCTPPCRTWTQVSNVACSTITGNA